MISDNMGATLNSTVQTIATDSLDGTLFRCLDGFSANSPEVGNITIIAPGKLIIGIEM